MGSRLYRGLLLSVLWGFLTLAHGASFHDRGSFENPGAVSRPRFRYWVPDASVNLSRIEADISDAGRIGAGGVELLGYYNYGNIQLGAVPIATDWGIYGWGLPAWREVQDTAVRATKANGLVIDLAMGPNQGAGVPAPFESDGLAWDLQPFNVTISVGETFDKRLPGWGTGRLVSASTGLVIDTANVTSRVKATLSNASLMDVTDQVLPDGTINLTMPSDVTGQHYILFAYYLIHTNYRAQETPERVIPGVPQSDVTDYIQNGSWVVDHFSSRGAQAVIDFWQTYLLNGSDTTDLLSEVGTFLWEDSQEFSANFYWTPSLPSAFEANFHYNINKFIPVVIGTEGISGISSTTAELIYVTDEEDEGHSHIAAYSQTLTLLNQDYLHTIAAWAHSLGMESSTQVGYNLPIDMLANVPLVDAPECETFGLFNNIDIYRQFVGPAVLAGRSVISSETGTEIFQAFQQFLPYLAWTVKRSIVGGVNNFVFHGLPYSGAYPNSTWPSFTPLFYIFAELHNRHLPSWEFYGDFMNYTARSQLITQSGVAKVDLAFWLKETSYTELHTRYEPNDLAHAGFTYEYLSPDLFSLATAFVEEGMLAPTQQSFKAIIVRANDTMTRAGVEYLSQWAQQGLPIIFSGGIPSTYFDRGISSANYISSALQNMTSLSNVHVVPYADLASSLHDLQITPRSRVSQELDVSSASTLYTRWREHEEESVSYIFVYNDAAGLSREESLRTVNFTFETMGAPQIYDTWTGAVYPIPHYSATEDTTTVPLTLAGNQTTVVAFKRSDTSDRAAHITHASQRVNVMYVYDSSGGHSIVTTPGPSACTLHWSNGSSTTVPPSSYSPIMLEHWNLTVEAWRPGDLSDIESTLKENSSYTLQSLTPWSQIPDFNLSHVSGRGYYSTTFQWPPPAREGEGERRPMGAVIDFGSIVHTISAQVNGRALPPLDPTAAKADISAYITDGVNEVDVVVSTPYGNGLIPYWDNLATYGQAPGNDYATLLQQTFGGSLKPSVQEYGLVDAVTVKAYDGVRV